MGTQHALSKLSCREIVDAGLTQRYRRVSEKRAGDRFMGMIEIPSKIRKELRPGLALATLRLPLILCRESVAAGLSDRPNGSQRP
jgi:hypothetical protein